MRRFEYVRPKSAEQAAQLVSEGASVAKAGGIDLLDRMKEGITRPSRLVALLPAVDDLVLYMLDGGSVRMGAGNTLAKLARDGQLRAKLPSLCDAAGEAATPQVREAATLGGNLLQQPRCWYYRSRHYNCLRKGGGVCWAQQGRNEFHALYENERSAMVNPSNTAPALISLRAELEITNASGMRRMPIEDLYISAKENAQKNLRIKDDELITGVVVPPETTGSKAAHYEVRQKQSFDWPLAIAAVNMNAKPRLVLGAVAAAPVRVSGVSKLLREAAEGTPSKALLDELADKALSGATPLPGNAWRVPLVRTAVRRAVQKAAGVPEENWQ